MISFPFCHLKDSKTRKDLEKKECDHQCYRKVKKRMQYGPFEELGRNYMCEQRVATGWKEGRDWNRVAG